MCYGEGLWEIFLIKILFWSALQISVSEFSFQISSAISVHVFSVLEITY